MYDLPSEVLPFGETHAPGGRASTRPRESEKKAARKKVGTLPLWRDSLFVLCQQATIMMVAKGACRSERGTRTGGWKGTVRDEATGCALEHDAVKIDFPVARHGMQ